MEGASKSTFADLTDFFLIFHCFLQADLCNTYKSSIIAHTYIIWRVWAGSSREKMNLPETELSVWIITDNYGTGGFRRNLPEANLPEPVLLDWIIEYRHISGGFGQVLAGLKESNLPESVLAV